MDKISNKTETTGKNEGISSDREIVKDTIKTLKNGRATAIGGTPTELLKYVTDKLYKLLRNRFENCLNGDVIPDDWKVGFISTIHKRGKK